MIGTNLLPPDEKYIDQLQLLPYPQPTSDR